MKILYVNHYAGSTAHGMEFRPFYLAREWVRAGHEVLIVAASYSHVRAVQPEMDGPSATRSSTECGTAGTGRPRTPGTTPGAFATCCRFSAHFFVTRDDLRTSSSRMS